MAEGTGIFAEAFTDIRHADENNRAEAYANACLIASAPELKAVAEGFRFSVGAEGCLWLTLPLQNGGNGAMFNLGTFRKSGAAAQAALAFEKLRNAALSKARGEQ
jgi:hypothetical protein